jgi:hypothetical protein
MPKTSRTKGATVCDTRRRHNNCIPDREHGVWMIINAACRIPCWIPNEVGLIGDCPPLGEYLYSTALWSVPQHCPIHPDQLQVPSTAKLQPQHFSKSLYPSLIRPYFLQCPFPSPRHVRCSFAMLEIIKGLDCNTKI